MSTRLQRFKHFKCTNSREPLQLQGLIRGFVETTLDDRQNLQIFFSCIPNLSILYVDFLGDTFMIELESAEYTLAKKPEKN